jgi:antagonist of KipI
MKTVRMLNSGEQGLVVELGNGIDPVVNDRVHRLAEFLAKEKIDGIEELVPTYRSLMIVFDPLIIGRKKLVERVLDLLGTMGPGGPAEVRKKVIRIPVCYGGEFGPDLDFVAGRNGLSTEEVIRIHSSDPYRVYMLGFSPGFPYLGGMSERIAAPRLEKPRQQVPAGSVGIAGRQTGIYPVDSPGGWRIIGRTPLRLFNPGSSKPFPVSPGDAIRFEPIDAEEFRRLKNADVTGASPATAISPGVTDTGVITVLKPGLLTTVQDEGRHGYRAFGMPVSGSMDRYAFRIANILAGNEPSDAALEMTLQGGSFRFESGAYIAVCGADMRGRLNGAAIRNWSGFFASPGSELTFGHAVSGCRTYLAVQGGISVPPIMGSCATYLRGGLGGSEGRALRAGDVLPCVNGWSTPEAERVLPRRFVHEYPNEIRLRVLPGPQKDLFAAEGITAFYSSRYVVTPRNDRMGYLLEGAEIRHLAGADIISDALCSGAVQVPGNGMPIIMTADHQTIGGYAKIGTVIGPDLTRLVQARQGNGIRFVRCDVGEAVRALRSERGVYSRIQAVFPRMNRREEG